MSATDAITLYETGRSRSMRARWALAEAGLGYDSVQINLATPEGRAPLVAVNPLGKVPTLVHRGRTLIESVAICTYVGQLVPERALVPVDGSAARTAYDQWTWFLMTELEQPLWTATKHKWLYPEARRSEDAIAIAYEEFKRALPVVEKHLAEQTYLAGASFTMADVIGTHILLWASSQGLLIDAPACAAYVTRNRARAAFPSELYVN